MELMMIEVLGFAAGAITLVSSIPQLVANLRNRELAMAQSLSRNCLWNAPSELVRRYAYETEDREWRTSGTSPRK